MKFRIKNILSQLLTAVNGKFARGILVDIGDFQFLVEINDMFVGRQLRKKGNYGKHELRIIDKVINKNSVVIFVGTHIGALAIPTAKKVKKAHFIEANPKVFAFLEANTAINKTKNVTLHNYAAGEKTGEINFIINRINSGGSKREPVIKENIYYYDNPKTISIAMKPIDDIVTNQEDYDLVFMDIEGSEYFALQGMQKTLEKTQCLIMEFIVHHLKNVSQVSVEDLLALIEPHFNHLYIPSLDRYCSKDEFGAMLLNMYESGINDDGIIFTKQRIKF